MQYLTLMVITHREKEDIARRVANFTFSSFPRDCFSDSLHFDYFGGTSDEEA